MGASTAGLLAADDPDEMKPIVDLLTQTRKSLTLRSLFMTGFPHDPEFFAAGVALARQWTRQGLKVAVVDLDYRHPTLQRPRPDPNEGYVDALEYGCSFQRIAWELVADTLWLVGPGSHPPDETRFAEHSDWARVMRIFSGRVDLTLYLAPFLDRKGFTGSLSKRMDGVLLAASVQRSGRAALRDAFLELWGSDAPMIGCLGLAAPYGSAPRGEVELGPVSSPAAPSDWSFPSPDASTKSRVPTPDRRGASMAAQPEPKPAPEPESSQQERRSRPRPAPPVRPQPDIPPPSLVSRLSEEVRTGRPTRTASPNARGLLILGLLLVILAGVGAYLTVQAMRRPGSRAAVPAETLPAGTEAVLPAPGDGADSPATEAQSVPGTDESAAEAPAGDAGLPPPPPAPSPGSVASTVARTPASVGLKFQVHVASFRSESKVRDLVKSLRERGLDSWYAAAADQPGWYRVFIGHYATHGEAASKAAWLLDRGWVERARAYPDKER